MYRQARAGDCVCCSLNDMSMYIIIQCMYSGSPLISTLLICGVSYYTEEPLYILISPYLAILALPLLHRLFVDICTHTHVQWTMKLPIILPCILIITHDNGS